MASNGGFTNPEQKEGVPDTLRIVTFTNEPVPTLGPFNASSIGWKKAGGDGVVAEMQSRLLKELGHDVTVLSPQPLGHIPGDQFHAFLNSETLSRYDLINHPLGNDSLVADIQLHVKGCDIIYMHSLAAGTIIVQMKEAGLLDPQVKLVYMGHTWSNMIDKVTKGAGNPLKVGAERQIILSVDRVIVGTQAEAEILADEYENDQISRETILSKIIVIPLGVDNSIFNPTVHLQIRNQVRGEYLDELDSSLNFFMLSGINPLKGQLETVMAFCQLLEKNPSLDISLSIFGGPREGKQEYFEQVRGYVK